MAESRTPAGWVALLLGIASLLLVTNHPVVVATTALCVVAAGHLLAGPRAVAFRQFVSLATVMALFRLALALLLAGDPSGAVLLRRPEWQPAPGVAFGGPLTLETLLLGLIASARVFAFTALAGLAYQAVAPAGWVKLSRAFLGRGASLMAPWCHFGGSLAAAWQRAQLQAGQGFRPTLAGRWAGALRGAVAAAHEPPTGADAGQGRGVAVLRRVTLMCLGALPVVVLSGILPRSVTGPLSTADLALLVCVPMLVLVALSSGGSRAMTLTGLGVLLLVTARALVPGAPLTWAPDDGWQQVPFVWVLVALVLPVAAALDQRRHEDA